MNGKLGRFIPYVYFGDEQKTSEFTSWLKNQIAVLELAINNDEVKDAVKSRRYHGATQKALSLSCFPKGKKDPSMRITRRALKIQTGATNDAPLYRMHRFTF